MTIHPFFRAAPLAGVLLVAPLALDAQSAPATSRVQAAVELPRLAAGLRERGVPEADIRRALDAMRENDVAAGEAADVLRDELGRARDDRPTANFGAFVTEQVREGRRGRALAETIREAHGRRAEAARRRAAEER